MAEDRDDSQEKTEQATPKRQEDAREKGQVSRSRELNTMAILVAGSTSLYVLGGDIIKSLQHIMHDGFSIRRRDLFDAEFIGSALTRAGYDSLHGLSSLLLVLFVVALFAPMLVGGWSFSVQALGFNWDKLDPGKGLKRVLGVRGLMELAKALVKFLLIGGLVVLLLWTQIDKLLVLGGNGLFPGLADAGNEIVNAFMILSAATILIVIVDVPFQMWEHSQQLKMSKQEVKDEMKETEGRPEVKSRIRDVQQQMVGRRMLEEVPAADVVITNPTHFAVALKYDQEKMGAPRVVAKGMDFMAQRIRLSAEQHQVMIFSAPVLARALYFNARVGDEVPTGLYLAVAQVLAYVYQLKAWRRDPNVNRPERPEEITVPDEYVREVKGEG